MHVFTKNLQSILGPERFTDCLVEIDAVDFDKKNSEKQCEMRRKNNVGTLRGHRLYLAGGEDHRGVGTCMSRSLLPYVSKV